MQPDKKIQYRDLKGARCIGVDAVVGLDDDKSFLGRRGSVGEGGGERLGGGTQTGDVRG